MDTELDDGSYQPIHFEGSFSTEDCDRLCRVLRCAEEVGGWGAPPQYAGAAWIVVAGTGEDMVAASRYGTDLVFTGPSAGRLAAAVEAWIDRQASLHGDRPGRSPKEDREAAGSEGLDRDSTPPVQ